MIMALYKYCILFIICLFTIWGLVTELCAQYNRLCGRDQDMHSYMKFITNCSQIEVLTDNMDTLGPAFVETYFDAQSQKTLGKRLVNEIKGNEGLGF